MREKLISNIKVVLILFCLGLAILSAGKIGGSADNNRHNLEWVRLDKGEFCIGDKPFRFIGASAVYLSFYDDWGLDVETAIRTAAENNIRVLRVFWQWGWGTPEDMDRIIALASAYNLRIILTLQDCCCSCDCKTFDLYLKVQAPFCNIENKEATSAFQDCIRTVLLRHNSLTGRLYRDDPTIMAFEITNELEYWHYTYKQVHEWLKQMAAFIKSLDNRHLVTVGIPCFHQDFDSGEQAYALFNNPYIDFFSVHLYPSADSLVKDETNAGALEFYLGQLEKRISGFRKQGKPVIVGEGGIANSAYLSKAFRQSKRYAELAGRIIESVFMMGAKGFMFWGWGVAAEQEIPMWWHKESHSAQDTFFCHEIRKQSR